MKLVRNKGGYWFKTTRQQTENVLRCTSCREIIWTLGDPIMPSEAYYRHQMAHMDAVKEFNSANSFFDIFLRAD
jgi:hypothetical protein